MLDYSSFAPRKLLLNYFQRGWVQRSLCTDAEEKGLHEPAPLTSCANLSQSARLATLVFSFIYKEGKEISILKDYYQS